MTTDPEFTDEIIHEIEIWMNDTECQKQNDEHNHRRQAANRRRNIQSRVHLSVLEFLEAVPAVFSTNGKSRASSFEASCESVVFGPLD